MGEGWLEALAAEYLDARVMKGPEGREDLIALSGRFSADGGTGRCLLVRPFSAREQDCKEQAELLRELFGRALAAFGREVLRRAAERRAPKAAGVLPGGDGRRPPQGGSGGAPKPPQGGSTAASPPEEKENPLWGVVRRHIQVGWHAGSPAPGIVLEVGRPPRAFRLLPAAAGDAGALTSSTAYLLRVNLREAAADMACEAADEGTAEDALIRLSLRHVQVDVDPAAFVAARKGNFVTAHDLRPAVRVTTSHGQSRRHVLLVPAGPHGAADVADAAVALGDALAVAFASVAREWQREGRAAITYGDDVTLVQTPPCCTGRRREGLRAGEKCEAGRAPTMTELLCQAVGVLVHQFPGCDAAAELRRATLACLRERWGGEVERYCAALMDAPCEGPGEGEGRA